MSSPKAFALPSGDVVRANHVADNPYHSHVILFQCAYIEEGVHVPAKSLFVGNPTNLRALRDAIDFALNGEPS